MHLPGTLAEKIDTFFREGRIIRNATTRQLQVLESSLDGQAEVTIVINGPCQTLTVHLEKDPKAFGYLKDLKSVDGVFLIEQSNLQWACYLIECKRTIRAQTWGNIKAQFRTSLVKALAIAGILEINIEQFRLISAFVNDEMAPLNSPDPVLMKLPVGEAPTALSRELKEWDHPTIELHGVSHVPHSKLLMTLQDDIARAELELTVP